MGHVTDNELSVQPTEFYLDLDECEQHLIGHLHL